MTIDDDRCVNVQVVLPERYRKEVSQDWAERIGSFWMAVDEMPSCVSEFEAFTLSRDETGFIPRTCLWRHYEYCRLPSLACRRHPWPTG